VESYKKIDLPLPRKIDTGSFSGEVIYIDCFGNLITNFSEQFMSKNVHRRPVKIKIGSCLISGLKSHYSEANPREVSALLNSWNNLEIFLPSANAANFLKAQEGDLVEIETG
jgi:S-adenosylmethionine hydrolase